MKLKKYISLVLSALMLINVFGSSVVSYADNISSFTDVKEDAWYYYDVMEVASKGIMKGTSASAFSPTDTLSRAMCVTILHRMSGESAPAEMNTCFTDVPTDTWYTEAVTWAYSHGIVKGKTDSSFAPNDNITRAEFVTVLSRYAYHMELELPEIRDGSLKDSMLTPAYAKLSEQLMYRAGVVNGLPGEKFMYYAKISRAEAAAMINRFNAKATVLDPDAYTDVVFIGNSITQSGHTRDHFEALAVGKNIKVHDYSDGGVYLADHYNWFVSEANSPYVNTVEEAEIVIFQEYAGGFPQVGNDEELYDLRYEMNHAGIMFASGKNVVGLLREILGDGKEYYSYSANVLCGPMLCDSFTDWQGREVKNDNDVILKIQDILEDRFDLQHVLVPNVAASDPTLGLHLQNDMYSDLIHPTELMGYCIALTMYCRIFDVPAVEQNNGALTYDKIPGETQTEKDELMQKIKAVIDESLEIQK